MRNVLYAIYTLRLTGTVHTVMYVYIIWPETYTVLCLAYFFLRFLHNTFACTFTVGIPITYHGVCIYVCVNCIYVQCKNPHHNDIIIHVIIHVHAGFLLEGAGGAFAPPLESGN